MPIGPIPPSSKVPDPPNHSIIRYVEKPMDNNKTKIASTKIVKQVREIGAIATLNLPKGFVAGVSRDDSDGYMFKQYYLESDSTIKLFFEYRGHRIKKKYGESYLSLLKKGPHDIAIEKVYEYSPVFIEKSIKDDFKIELAKIVSIADKSVLAIEGTFPKHKIKARSIYIDTDGTGTAIQEVTFQTPIEKADKYFPDGIKALESIKWK